MKTVCVFDDQQTKQSFSSSKKIGVRHFWLVAIQHTHNIEREKTTTTADCDDNDGDFPFPLKEIAHWPATQHTR